LLTHFAKLTFTTKVSLLFNLIPEQTEASVPPWHEFKNSITLESGLLHLQSMRGHFHPSRLWHWQCPTCCFSGPNCLSACFD